MNGTQTHALPNQPVSSSSRSSAKWLAGSSTLEAAGAIAVIALSIVGLVGVFSPTMAAIATIVLGAAVMIEGGTLVAILERYSARGEYTEIRTGNQAMGLDFLGGIAAIVLGILALLGVDAQTLHSVSLLVLGSTFMFSELFMVGLAGVVLGILAVVGVASITLVLVGLLALGAAALMAGAGTATHALMTRHAT